MKFHGLALVLCGLFVSMPAAAQAQDSSLLEASLPGLTVRADERWIFRVVDGQPAQARRATEDERPAAGELMVSLDASGGTTMVVINNDATWYNYRAFITTRPGTKGNRTSVCTLMGGGRSAYETWPEAIPAIRIADFTTAETNTMDCR